MALPDVLRFCDAFELRPGLVSTREIVDGFKEVGTLRPALLQLRQPRTDGISVTWYLLQYVEPFLLLLYGLQKNRLLRSEYEQAAICGKSDNLERERVYMTVAKRLGTGVNSWQGLDLDPGFPSSNDQSANL